MCPAAHTGSERRPALFSRLPAVRRYGTAPPTSELQQYSSSGLRPVQGVQGASAAAALQQAQQPAAPAEQPAAAQAQQAAQQEQEPAPAFVRPPTFLLDQVSPEEEVRSMLHAAPAQAVLPAAGRSLPLPRV